MPTATRMDMAAPRTTARSAPRPAVRPLHRTKVTGVVGTVASAAVNKATSATHYMQDRGRRLGSLVYRAATAPLKYVGLMHTSRQNQLRRADEVRWAKLRRRLVDLHRGNNALVLEALPATVCPITNDVMRDPVTTPEGQSFEREAICMWLQHNETNPLTRAPLTAAQLVPNTALRQTIRDARRVAQELARLASASVAPRRTAV
jgi:hypothetical protein